MNRFIIYESFAIAFLILSYATANSAKDEDVASFDCSLAQGSVELLICSNKELRTLDGNLGVVYRWFGPNDFSSAERQSFIKAQRAWIRSRNDKCDQASPQDSFDCIKSMTEARLSLLRKLQIEKNEKDVEQIDQRSKREFAEHQQQANRNLPNSQEESRRSEDEFENDDPNTLNFVIRKDTSYAAQVSFYSQSRKFSWPGGSQAYQLNSNQAYTFALECNRGEKICYGGWIIRRGDLYWGAGYRGTQGCANCCMTCGSRRPGRFVLSHKGPLPPEPRREENSNSSGVSAADLLGAALGVAGVVIGGSNGSGSRRSSPPPSYGPAPRNRDSGVSGGR